MMTGVSLNPHSSLHASDEVGTCILKYAITNCNFILRMSIMILVLHGKIVDITEEYEEGVAVIQIHVRSVM